MMDRRKRIAFNPVEDEFDGYTWEGVHYEDIRSVVISAVFNFCGCGDEDGLYRLLLDGLKALRDKPNKRDDIETPAHWLLWNVYDQAGLTEHGGCLPGWLTPFGKQVLAAMEKDE